MVPCKNIINWRNILFNENKNDTTRVVLLNTTQIMTSGERPADRGGRIRGFSFWDEYFAIRCLLLMPIMVSMTIVFDWLYLLYTADDKGPSCTNMPF